LLAPSLTAVFLLLVIPVCFVIVYSFWLRAPTGADIPAFQFGNYVKFFEDFFYPKIMLQTIRVSLETVILCLIMGYIPAYFFFRTESRLKPVLLLLIMLPFWISFIIRTLSWINILGDTGLINHVLNHRSIDDRKHFFGYSLGCGKKARAQAGYRKDGLSDAFRGCGHGDLQA